MNHTSRQNKMRVILSKDWYYVRQTERLGEDFEIGACQSKVDTSLHRMRFDKTGAGQFSGQGGQCRVAGEAGWRFVISHRSGETEDTFMADFAVAMGGGRETDS
jgi:enolase